MANRATWSGTFGFVVTSIGAAIGLGNIWLFPWRLGRYGGAAFLLVYLFFVFVIARIGLMGEFGLGRSQKKGSIGAFETIYRKKNISFGAWIGGLPVIAQAGVFIFYSIVAGWVIRYCVLAVTGSFTNADIPALFQNLAAHPASIPWHAAAVAITAVIVILGITGGIETVNKIIMPALFVMFFILLIRSLFLPDAMKGVRYLLIPDWTCLYSIETYVTALGQAFFTVSLGGAGMVVLGSYLKDDVAVPSVAMHTVVFDTLIALCAAFIILPAVFSFGFDPAAGPPLLFITLPKIFTMMPGGGFFGFLFFLGVLFAAISTEIILLEVMVEAVTERTPLKRTVSAVILAVAAFLIGLPMDTNEHFFHLFVNIVTIYLIPFGAVLAAVTFFWVYGIDNAFAEINKAVERPLGSGWKIVAKYVFVGVSIMVLVLGIVYGGIG